MADALPNLPSFGLEFPPSKIVHAALAFAKHHCNLPTYNHALRSAYWAAIIAKRNPPLSGSELDLELVILSCILHDMGWAETKDLLSSDKRFEVDGANIARDFINKFNTQEGVDASEWDHSRIQRCWDAIALHTTFSIARYAAPEVAAAASGILADFQGPYFPNGPGGENLITLDEYLAKVMCGICRDKGVTTFDNFVGDFGIQFGLDGAATAGRPGSSGKAGCQHLKLLNVNQRKESVSEAWSYCEIVVYRQ
ncbi:hypothetical protein LMH87_000027 [Akanthomyces muscarius]|uniref:HD domain-containing protein n=1 Tax=Akanthomyces muscarius TaxID=2231603 RepID=A0A9W8QGI5_AKAMU|nr:hypothetical protein LMH87_000027 [Akanthomyces muscarius]KAJ4154748.1 hypothetical protein LMH87_000027 [Akanthomyces muscarius]